MNKVSFQGEHGAYSESVARYTISQLKKTNEHIIEGKEHNTDSMINSKWFTEEWETLPCKTFVEVLKNTEEMLSEISVIPVENSIEGTVGQSIDALTESKLRVMAEKYLKIEHCLIGTGKLEELDTVYSHPQALGQCSEFIQKNNLKTVPTYDTAGSVKIVKEMNDVRCASIASREAGELYDTPIIKENIENNSNNYTRFLILASDNAKWEQVKTKEKMKTSIIFSVKHEPGALYEILKEFNDNDIDLTKIESRPNKNQNWEYNFIVDFVGEVKNKQISDVLDNISKKTLFLKILGSYPIADLD